LANLESEKKANEFDSFLETKRVEVEQQAAFFASELTMYTAKADQVVNTLVSSIVKTTQGSEPKSWEDVACWRLVADVNSSTNLAMLNDSLQGIVGVQQEIFRQQACQKLGMWEMDYTAPCHGFLVCGGGSDAPVRVRFNEFPGASSLLPELIIFRVVLPTGGSRVIARGHSPVLHIRKSPSGEEAWKFSLTSQQAVVRAGERCIVSYTAAADARALPAIHFVSFS
jgi:hypothetical protein